MSKLRRGVAIGLGIALAWAMAPRDPQAQATADPPSTSNQTESDESREAKAIERLMWRPIGPTNNAGRVSEIVGVPGDPSTFYVGAAAGGLFTKNMKVSLRVLRGWRQNA